MPILFRIAFWFPLAICTYLALRSGPYPEAIRFPDVVLHVFALAYLTVALVLAHFDTDRNPRSVAFKMHWIPMAWMFFYSVALELAQTFTLDRQAEMLDVLWGTIGIGLGQTLYWGYVRLCVNPTN
ncbi:MAG: VanZ family protein [Pseudomonadota bacterium]|nr:VanZ family protein [Pseudomonadota bacterium]